MARLLSADVVTQPSGWRPRGASLTNTLSPSRCVESGKRGSPSEAESNHLENELANGREEAFTGEGQDGPGAPRGVSRTKRVRCCLGVASSADQHRRADVAPCWRKSGATCTCQPCQKTPWVLCGFRTQPLRARTGLAGVRGGGRLAR